MKLDENKEIWLKRVEEYRSSGLSQKTWCEENCVKATEATIENGLNFDVSDKAHSLDNIEVKASGTRKPKVFKRILNHFMENI